MQIDTVSQQIPRAVQPPQEHQLIDSDAIKAILYLGIRGDIVVPESEHKVDIIV